jgi:peptidoglycan/LPS O-acetylase OafA/YrhL
MPHRPDLDGLRGLAIVLVLVEHSGVRDDGSHALPFSPAMAGVTTFFVLSGFLITTSLAAEQRIDLRNFYLRRVVRLGPGLAALVGVVALVGILSLWAHPWLPGVLGSAAYVSNWMQAGGTDLGLLGHTWSLAIEEQFYALWPLAMLVVPMRWLLPLATAGAITGCAMYAARIGPVYWSTFSNGGAILAGCVLALARPRLPRVAGPLGAALIAVGALFWAQPVVVIGAVLVIAMPIAAFLPLGALGRRAYSLYLWNWPLVLVCSGMPALPLTFAAAEASYRLVERPIMRLYRERLTARQRTAIGASDVPFEGLLGPETVVALGPG